MVTSMWSVGPDYAVIVRDGKLAVVEPFTDVYLEHADGEGLAAVIPHITVYNQNGNMSPAGFKTAVEYCLRGIAIPPGADESQILESARSGLESRLNSGNVAGAVSGVHPKGFVRVDM